MNDLTQEEKNSWTDGIWDYYIDGTHCSLSGIKKVNLLDCLHTMGYYRWKGKLVKKSGPIIEELDRNECAESFKNDIRPKQAVTLVKAGRASYNIAYSHFAHVFNEKVRPLFYDNTLDGLRELEGEPLRDKHDMVFFFFQNGYLFINEDGKTFLPYEDVSDPHLLILKKDVIPYDYKGTMEHRGVSPWESELKEAFGSNIEEAKKAIGYLIHNYRAPGLNKAVVFLGDGLESLKIGPSLDLVRKSDSFFVSESEEIMVEDTNVQISFGIGEPPIEALDTLFNQLTSDVRVQKSKYKKPVFVPHERAPKFFLGLTKDRFSYLGLSYTTRMWAIETQKRLQWSESKNITQKDHLDYIEFLADCVMDYMDTTEESEIVEMQHTLPVFDYIDNPKSPKFNITANAHGVCVNFAQLRNEKTIEAFKKAIDMAHQKHKTLKTD